MNRRLLIALLFGLAVLVTIGGYLALVGPSQPNTVIPASEAIPDRQPVVTLPDVPFTDVTAAAGIQFRHINGATGAKLLPETMGGGVAVLDYDRDGWPDLLFVSGCEWPGTPDAKPVPCLTLYRNNGDGTFTDVTAAARLDTTFYGMGVCAGDFDNDGYTDLFITGVGGHRLYRNVAVGAGRGFEDVTTASGITAPGAWPTATTQEEFVAHREPIPFGSSATFLDYDRDGKLDLFVCHYVTWSPAIDLGIKATLVGTGERAYQQPQQLEGSQCRLYRNNGGGRFTDVTIPAGVEVTRKDGTSDTARRRPVAKALAVAACDPDGDGYPDVFVANDTVQNFYFRNVPAPGGGRKFEEVSHAVNAAYADGRPRGAMGVDYGEYAPGQNGLVVANFANEPVTFLTPRRGAEGVRFTNKALAVGLENEASRSPLKFGAFFFDYDLDGRQDLLLCNGHLEPEIAKIQSGQLYQQPARLFWNTGGQGGARQFEPVPPTGALGTPIVGRGSAYLDFDGDGDLDVVLVANNGPALLLRNDQALNHHFIRLDLEGDGQTANTSAIGADVLVEANGQTFRREVPGARGYLSQSEQTVTVGFGPTKPASVKVTVRWPADGAAPQVWDNLAPNERHVLKQGAAVARNPGR